MPLFFFDKTNGSVSCSDSSGLPFAGIHDARAHAMTLLPVMGVELPMKPGEFKSWTVIVRDETDMVVCRLIMGVINDDLTPGAARILSPAPKS